MSAPLVDRQVEKVECVDDAWRPESLWRAKAGKKRNTFLQASEAFYTGVGVLIGMSLFATNRSDFVFGGALFVLLLLSLSTPEVLDMEHQYSSYKAQHQSKVNHVLHALCVWPRFITFMVMVSAQSSWASLITAYYAMYFVISDRSLIGVVAALLVLLSSGLAKTVVSLYDEVFLPACYLHCVCWNIQLLSHLFFEKRDTARTLAFIVLDNFLQFVLMSPLLVTIECAIGLGFRKDFARRASVNVCNMRTERKLRSDSESSDRS
jgi:uncharacterized membrane protein YGL010W